MAGWGMVMGNALRMARWSFAAACFGRGLAVCIADRPGYGSCRLLIVPGL
jgi:hypothetical protein